MQPCFTAIVTHYIPEDLRLRNFDEYFRTRGGPREVQYAKVLGSSGYRPDVAINLGRGLQLLPIQILWIVISKSFVEKTALTSHCWFLCSSGEMADVTRGQWLRPLQSQHTYTSTLALAAKVEARVGRS